VIGEAIILAENLSYEGAVRTIVRYNTAYKFAKASRNSAHFCDDFIRGLCGDSLLATVEMAEEATSNRLYEIIREKGVLRRLKIDLGNRQSLFMSTDDEEEY